MKTLVKTVETTLPNGMVRSTISGFEDKLRTYRKFVHIEGSPNVGLDTKTIPDFCNVRIDGSPEIYNGEHLFGLEDDGKITWLGNVTKPAEG